MGKKMKQLIPLFLSQSKTLHSSTSSSSSSSSSSSWAFPACGNIKTLSFRHTNNNHNLMYKDDNFRTFNSVFIDSANNNNTNHITNSDSFFTLSSSSLSFSTMSEDTHLHSDPIESGLKSDRLFFEPEQSCSLVLKQQQEEEDEEKEVIYKESEAMGMESSNPCQDFRISMEEMVEAHGLKDWKGLEELLGCYLKINNKINHPYIMAAFIDLLVNLSFISSSSSNNSTTITTISTQSSNNLNSSFSSPSSPLSLPSSSLTTPSLSSLFDHDQAWS